MRMSGTPHDPIIINDRRYLNVWQAAHIVETITEQTLWRWAKHGTTPFGLELGVIRHPVTHHRTRHSNEPPKQHLTSRMLIPEEKVFALKEILGDNPLRPGPLSKADMTALEAAARRFRSPQRLASHLTNS
jgi:hypothetical protein